MALPRASAARQAAPRPGTGSYWLATTPPTHYPGLEEDVRVDVAIAGGGIAGLMAAYFLAKAGRSVAVLERWRLAEAETGHTTAHLTSVVDTRLKDLVRLHGKEGAKAAWDSSAFAIDLVERVARDEGIACDFERLYGYLYGDRDEDPRVLGEEARLARELGHEVEELGPGSVPFPAKAVLRFPRQAKFHPLKFLGGLAQRLTRMGVHLHEGTEVVELDPEALGGPARVAARTRHGPRVWADLAVSAANVAIFEYGNLYLRYFPYRSYVVAARVPRGKLRDALYWSTFDPGELYGPYYYTRVEALGDEALVILGGEDHKAGQERDPEAAWDRLQGYLEEALGDVVAVEHRWSGHIIETMDGLPLIGRNPGAPEHALVALGFSGNGMTFGPLAGWMLAERILGRGTPWDRLYDPGRVTLAPRELLQENLDFPVNIVAGLWRGGEVEDPAELERGEGAIMVRDGKKLAVARDLQGQLHAVSARCTHLGCSVAWNRAEQSWDCPCHGSRFTADGAILNAPATEPLEPVDLEQAGLAEPKPQRGRR